MKSVLASKACGPVNPARKMLALERTKKDRFINKNNDWTNQFESQPNPDFQEFNQVFEGSFTPVTFHQADFHPFQQNNLSEKHDEAFQEAFEQAIASTNEFEQAFDRAKATNEASYEFEEAFDRAKGKGKMNDWEQQFHEAINHLQINEV